MRKRSIVIALLAVLGAAPGKAQFSGYASSSYGYHSNPLSNYAGTPDHFLQGYWQLDYRTPSPSSEFTLGYLGGLMVFRNLALRDYYEHRVTVGVLQRYPGSTEKAEDEEDEPPFRGRTLELGARVGARHDRSEYRQFDNWGGDVFTTYTWGVGTPGSFALSNETGLRRYANVPELDNLTSVFSLRRTAGATEGTRYSLFGGAGIKHYVTSEVDTSVFATVGSSSSSNGRGKGKGKGIFSGTGNGKKDLLVNASSVNTIQLHVGVGVAWQWEGGSAHSEVLYRIDPGSKTRILAQYTNSTLLSEDLYNDFFSHAGPEFKLTLRQKLPLGFNVTAGVVAQRRKYLSPAYTLDGLESASARVDLHGKLELSLTRWIALGESLGFDVGVGGELVRNQSNDAYNDFSGSQYSLVVGIGL